MPCNNLWVMRINEAKIIASELGIKIPDLRILKCMASWKKNLVAYHLFLI